MKHHFEGFPAQRPPDGHPLGDDQRLSCFYPELMKGYDPGSVSTCRPPA
jgi:hypothetical protein